MITWIFFGLLVLWMISIIVVIAVLLIRPVVEQKKINRGLSMNQYQIKVPKTGRDTTQNLRELIARMEQVYDSFSSLKRGKSVTTPHISLEIVSPTERDEIHFYIGIPKGYESTFEKQFHAVYPDAELTVVEDYNVLTTKGEIRAAYLKLEREAILPIRTYQTLETDPLSGITSALSKIQADESAVVQILIRRAPAHWGDNAVKVAKKMQEGKSYRDAKGEVSGNLTKVVRDSLSQSKPTQQEKPNLSPAEEEMVEKLEAKASKAAFISNIRLMTIAPEAGRSQVLMNQLEGAFTQFSTERWNQFKINRYNPAKLERFLYKFIFRIFDTEEGMILNTEELTSLYHIPTPFLETPKVQWVTTKASYPPSDLPREGVVIAENTYRGEQQIVRIQPEDRRRHMYVIGQTGTGKTSLMKKMIQEDLRAGRGLALLDPNGDLATEILSMIPQERIEDVIYVNPQDVEYPIGLNMLEASTPEEKDFVIQEMIAIFYRVVSDPSMIGPVFEHNMRMAMAALMADSQNPYTLVEIPKMFTDTEFRNKVLTTVSDPIIRDFWTKEFPASQKGAQAGDTLGYILSKLGRFIENEMVRNIIGQRRSSFDFREVMDDGKILIANLSKGAIGDMNANLLGMVLVSKLQMAAFKRGNIPEDQRRDFYLYLDEFQNFTTDSISTILSEARKYRLNLTLAHQFIGQLPDGIRTAVMGNVGTTICFRIGTEDTEVLAQKMAPDYSGEELLALDNLNAVIKLMIDGKSSKAFNVKVIFADPGNQEVGQAIQELSRLTYGTKVELVTQEMNSR